MYWRITEDLLYDGTGDIPSRVGTERKHATHDEPIYNAIQVRLLDDDEIHYYTAICEEDEESLEDLFYWAQRDAGTTIMQTKKDGKWVDEIA